MTQYNYLQLHISDILENVIQHYELQQKATDGYIFVEIRRKMYGLAWAGHLA